LSHPLIVDAAEHAFVPLCIYNNTKNDADAGVLARFKEPAWNNPVVRCIDTSGADIVSRVSDDWSVAALAGAMRATLAKRGTVVPRYLELLALETGARAERTLCTATFGMG
jgi:hypothetical protein